MLIGNNIASSLNIILSHKIRSFLTLLGLIIGVLAVVSIFSAVDGVKATINNSIGGMGWDNSFEITTKSDQENQRHYRWGRQQTGKREAKPINLNDYYLLKKDLDAKYIYASVEGSAYDRNSKYSQWTRIKGTNREYFDFKKYELVIGRNINNLDEQQAANVCLVGTKFWEQYMKSDKNIIGQKLTLGDYRYTIIGVIGEKTASSRQFDFNYWERHWDLTSIFVPLETGVKFYSIDQQVQ